MTSKLEAWREKADIRQVTPRALAAGLAIGTVVLFSNFQFGLQTGWVSMMGLPSALLGFAVFRTLKNRLTYPFTDVENVFVQSLSAAVGTGPLAYGLVGVVPAIEKFMDPTEGGRYTPLKLNLVQLTLWSFGLAFFGVFLAFLLRRQIVVREKLRFPSGSATATLIGVLHRAPVEDVVTTEDDLQGSVRAHPETGLHVEQAAAPGRDDGEAVYKRDVQVLTKAFAISGAYTVLAYFVPLLRDLPVFGPWLAKRYLWTLQPSPAYVGQGIIMGFHTTASMLFGAFLGWAVLAPLAEHKGWATGPIDDWKTGGQGWILWISLAIMVADTVVSFTAFSAKSLHAWYIHARGSSSGGPTYERVDNETSVMDGIDHDHDHDLDPSSEHLIPVRAVLVGLALTSVLCIAATRAVFGSVIPMYACLIAVLVALVLSVLGVRALGETDLNPVSGIGKISQILFAVVVPRDHPGAVLVNLVAGGITEAGAQQAGDLMQDLKTGHLVGASPKAQFIAQMIGSVYSAFVSAAVYKLYDSVYDVPNDVFRIPTARIWIDTARLATGQGLPEGTAAFAYWLGGIFAALAVVKAVFASEKHSRWTRFIPSGVAVGIGIYNTPSFTLARFAGGCYAAYFFSRYRDHDSTVWAVVLASGLILGEGVFSILSLIFTSLGVPHF